MGAAFWTLAPVMVLAALGILVVRKAVHAALLLAVVMICLAVQYAALDAPFLFAVQIVVYTGAILMLFLFVVMLVGVDASDSVVETIRGQRLLALAGGLALGLTLVIGVAQLSLGTMEGLTVANRGGNIQALADLLFSRYVLAFEVTSALLITAAIGAMVLAHRERLDPRPTQADLAARRVRDFAEHGTPLGPLPAPGTFARHNAVDTPALLPDGSIAEASLNKVLVARGTVRDVPRPGRVYPSGLTTPSPEGPGYATAEGSTGGVAQPTDGTSGSGSSTSERTQRSGPEEHTGAAERSAADDPDSGAAERLRTTGEREER